MHLTKIDPALCMSQVKEDLENIRHSELFCRGLSLDCFALPRLGFARQNQQVLKPQRRLIQDDNCIRLSYVCSTLARTTPLRATYLKRLCLSHTPPPPLLCLPSVPSSQSKGNPARSRPAALHARLLSLFCSDDRDRIKIPSLVS